jgi:hypothetical protein
LSGSIADQGQKAHEPRCGRAQAVPAGLEHCHQGERAGEGDDAESSHDPRPDRQAETGPGEDAGCRRYPRIGLE